MVFGNHTGNSLSCRYCKHSPSFQHDHFSRWHSTPTQGYSHGSLIASLLPLFPSVKTSHVLISYPLGPRSWLTLFKSSSYDAALKGLIKQDNSNVLIVYGDQDEFTSLNKYQAWSSELIGGGNVEVREIHNGSHFWRGKSAMDLIAVMKEWMNRTNI